MKSQIKAVLRPMWGPFQRRIDTVVRTQNDSIEWRLRRENEILRERIENLFGALRATDERVGSTMARVDELQRELSIVKGALGDEALYKQQIARELNQFNDQVDVHALPAIYHYWSERHLAPFFKELGIESVEGFYAEHLKNAAVRVGGAARFVSVGAGNCDTEIRVAKVLLEAGLQNFSIECLELNPTMLQRGRQMAAECNVAEHFVFTEADFNRWTPQGIYTGVMANQSLHHVSNLEGLLDAIKTALHPKGYFVTSDMIGRNGHQRWPEALEHVNALWNELPSKYKFNQLLQRQEDNFVNWDCSGEGFEGIRAQEILPLLIDRFDFEIFLGFANAINPFVDRCFGHNFDANSESDRAFIDKVHLIDEEGFRTGELKPTQMLAVLSPEVVLAPRFARGLSAKASVRVAR